MDGLLVRDTNEGLIVVVLIVEGGSLIGLREPVERVNGIANGILV